MYEKFEYFQLIKCCLDEETVKAHKNDFTWGSLDVGVQERYICRTGNDLRNLRPNEFENQATDGGSFFVTTIACCLSQLSENAVGLKLARNINGNLEKKIIWKLYGFLVVRSTIGQTSTITSKVMEPGKQAT